MNTNNNISLNGTGPRQDADEMIIRLCFKIVFLGLAYVGFYLHINGFEVISNQRITYLVANADKWVPIQIPSFITCNISFYSWVNILLSMYLATFIICVKYCTSYPDSIQMNQGVVVMIKNNLKFIILNLIIVII